MDIIYFSDVSISKTINNPRRIVYYYNGIMMAINPNNPNWYEVESVYYDHIRGKDWYLEEITEQQAKSIARDWGATLYV